MSNALDIFRQQREAVDALHAQVAHVGAAIAQVRADLDALGDTNRCTACWRRSNAGCSEPKTPYGRCAPGVPRTRGPTGPAL